MGLTCYINDKIKSSDMDITVFGNYLISSLFVV